MMWGRKKTIQTTPSAPSISSFRLNTWLLRFKKTKDRIEPVLDDGFYWRISFDKERYENDVILHNSDYRLNLSPVGSGSFKKTAPSNGRKMREFIDEDGVKSAVDRSGVQRSKLDSDLETVVEEERGKLKNMKINEIMLKSEKQRKSVDVRKETRRKRSKHRRKVDAFSPRVECRIKALDDMKRTRMKKPVKDAFRAGLNSFAVVKSSFNPQRDFRDSMIEMIIKNGIRQRDELEELLACYLILNCDEYHHLIIKVFQQVWLEFNHFDAYYLADF